MGRAPYDERNEKDYADVTKRIEDALKKMEDDKTIPATEAELCKLAKCSRGTLRNRQWPLERLKEIKKKRKGEKSDVPVEDENELEDQLKNSRTEAARWFYKFKNMEEENKKLSRANEHLQTTKQRLQERVDELERELCRLKPTAEHGQVENVVVPFPQSNQGTKPADA